MNTAAKGRRQEHRSMAIYEARGFTCIRAAGSRGPWDFVAWNRTAVHFVQVRHGRWPSSDEFAVLRGLVVPKRGARVVHRWMARAKAPEIRYL